VHDPAAVAVVVSALIFEVERDALARGEKDTVLSDWRRRIDRVVVVTAPDQMKIARYVGRLELSEDQRAAAEADARARLEHQVPDELKAGRADYVIENKGDIAQLREQTKRLWEWLQAQSNNPGADGSLI